MENKRKRKLEWCKNEECERCGQILKKRHALKEYNMTSWGGVVVGTAKLDCSYAKHHCAGCMEAINQGKGCNGLSKEEPCRGKDCLKCRRISREWDKEMRKRSLSEKKGKFPSLLELAARVVVLDFSDVLMLTHYGVIPAIWNAIEKAIPSRMSKSKKKELLEKQGKRDPEMLSALGKLFCHFRPKEKRNR